MSYPRNIIKPVIPSLKPTTAGLWKEDELGVTVYKATSSESSLDVTAGNFYWVDKFGVHHIWASGIEILETSILPVSTPGVGDPLIAINTTNGIIYTYNPIDEEWQPISDQAPTNENIYNINGSLTGDRTLDGLDSHSLTFDNLAAFNVNAAGSNIYIDDLSNTSFTNLSITTANFGLLASNMASTEYSTILFQTDTSYIQLNAPGVFGQFEITSNLLKLEHSVALAIKTPNVVGSTATVGQILTLQDAATGEVEYVNATVDTNIYLNNGTLSSDRTLTGAGFDLTFTGIQDFLYESNGSAGNVTFNLNNGISGLGVFLVNVENSTNASDHVIKLVADTANNYGILLSSLAGRIQIDSSDLEITNDTALLTSNIFTIDAATELHLITPTVNATTAVVGEFLTLIDAANGECEWTSLYDSTTVTPVLGDFGIFTDTSDSNKTKKNTLEEVLKIKPQQFTYAAPYMGATPKVLPLGLDFQQLTTTFTLSDQTARFIPFFVYTSCDLTGVWFYQSTQGNYTGDEVNGMALYSYDGAGNLTKVAETTNDADFWKGASATWIQKAFSAVYTATPGMYWVEFVYNVSSQTTAPIIGAAANGNTVAMNTLFTNNVQLHASKNSQTTLAATHTMASLTGQLARPFVMLY